MPKGQKDMIYLIGVPRPKGILLSLVEIWVHPCSPTVTRRQIPRWYSRWGLTRIAKSENVPLGALEMGIFLLLLKPNQAPFHSNIMLQTPMKFAFCHVPLDLFLASLISRFWTPLEYLCFSLISTVVFPFLSGILASWGWSRFLTYSSYVCFCDLGGLSPLPHFITHG